MTNTQILELTNSLVKAKEYAECQSDVEDEGTCNFDHPQILFDVNTCDAVGIHRAFEAADIECYIQRSGKFIVAEVLGCMHGQANKRTTMAEAFRDSLKNDGYEAYVYYQID